MRRKGRRGGGYRHDLSGLALKRFGRRTVLTIAQMQVLVADV